MPTSLEQLKQFAEETIEDLLKELPAERLLEGISVEDRLKDLSPDEMLAAMSPEKRAALAQRLKDYDQSQPPQAADAEPGERK